MKWTLLPGPLPEKRIQGMTTLDNGIGQRRKAKDKPNQQGYRIGHGPGQGRPARGFTGKGSQHNGQRRMIIIVPSIVVGDFRQRNMTPSRPGAAKEDLRIGHRAFEKGPPIDSVYGKGNQRQQENQQENFLNATRRGSPRPG